MSDSPADQGAIQVTNALPLSIDLYQYDPRATPPTSRFVARIPHGATLVLAPTQPVIRALVSSFGAIVDDIPVDPAPTAPIVVGPRSLCEPFAIGRPPEPSDALLLPPDTVPRLVGVGLWTMVGPLMHSVVTREQFWHKSPQSYSLPPHTKEQKVLRQTTGRMETSSTSTEASDELNGDVGAGWGPFSASVSAALSTTTRRTDVVTIRDSSTATVVQDFWNNTDQPVIVYLWQIVERIRLIVGSTCAVAVDSAIGPLLPMSHTIRE